jgi:hypothetical protein
MEIAMTITVAKLRAVAAARRIRHLDAAPGEREGIRLLKLGDSLRRRGKRDAGKPDCGDAKSDSDPHGHAPDSVPGYLTRKYIRFW